MTNPDNAVGTNAAYGGRTSVNAFNDNLSAYSRGVMSGWTCTPAGGLIVSLGGNGTERDVAVAEDNIGNKTSINNISGAPITLTMSAAPGSGTRIDSIVAYVDASPQGEATVTDNYGACGLIVVQGTPSSTPTAPSDNEIRSAITSDGASGPTAYYVVLANINMASGTTDITDGEIMAGDVAKIASQNLDFTKMSYSLSEQETPYTWVDGKTIYSKTIYVGNLPNAGSKDVAHNITNIDSVVSISGVATNPSVDGDPFSLPIPYSANVLEYFVSVSRIGGNIRVYTGSDRSQFTAYINMLYTKN